MYLSLTIVGIPSENTLLGGGNFCLSSFSDRTFSMLSRVATVRGFVLAQSTKNVANVRTGGGRNHANCKISRTAGRLRGTEPSRTRIPFATCGSQSLDRLLSQISSNIIRLPSEVTLMLRSKREKAM